MRTTIWQCESVADIIQEQRCDVEWDRQLLKIRERATSNEEADVLEDCIGTRLVDDPSM